MSANSFYSSIKSVEDILRNGVSKLTCDDAFEEISNLILLKLIEKDIESNKINKKVDIDSEILLDEECKFSNIYDKYCVDYDKKIEEGKIKKGDLFKLLYDNERHLDKYYDEKLDAWITKDNEKYDRLCVFKKLFHHKELSKTYQSSWKKYFKFEEKDEPDIVKSIIKINSAFNNGICTKEDIDLLGDAFEKYRDGVFGNKSGLGQYFTSMYIVKKILDEIKLTKDDKIFDPACGAGGFFIKAKNYIKEKYDKKEANKFAKNNVLGCEVDPRIFKILQLNAYLHGFKFENFELCDSVKSKDKHHIEEFDALVYNPPFGASIETTKGAFPIKTVLSVPLFLQLGFKALKKTGRCGVVVDEGIINNGRRSKTTWQGRIRQELLKNGLKKIIFLPEGAFQYTDHDTCILIYDRTYKEKKIIYEEGYFKEEDKGTRIKPLHFKNLGEITYEQVEKNNYNLKYKEYFGIKDNRINNKKWIQIKNCIEYIKFDSQKDDIKKEKGKYPFYTSSIIDHSYTDIYTNEDECLIINKVNGSGKTKIYYNNGKFSASSAVIIFKNNPEYKIRYLYYYLFLNKYDVQSKYEGGDKKSLNLNNFEKILIPKLNLDEQNNIIKFLDKYFEKNNIDEFTDYLGNFNIFQLLIEKNYDFFNNLQNYINIIKNAEKRIEVQDWKIENKRKYSKIIKEGYDLIGAYYNKIPNEDINELFQSKINLIIEKELIEKKKMMQIKGIFNCYLEESTVKKLGELVEFKNYKPVKIDKASDKGKYPFYNCSILGHLWSDEYLYEDEVLIMTKINGSGKYEIYYNNGKFTIASNLLLFNTKQNMKYIYYFIKFNKSIFEECFEGGDKKFLNVNNFKFVNIPIPSLEIQDKIVKQIERLDEKTSHYNIYSEVIQKELDQLTETIKNICKMKEVNEEDDSDDEESEQSESDDEQSNKSKSKSKKTKSDDNTSTKSTKSTSSSKSESSAKPNKSTKTNKSTKSKPVEEEIKVLPFKKNKSESKTKSKVETDSDSDSNSDSDSSSDSDSEPETKTKAKAKTKSSSTKKTSPVKNITVESDSEDESTNKKSSSKSKTVKPVKTTNSTKSTKSEPVDKKIKSKSTKPTDSEDEEELERQLSK